MSEIEREQRILREQEGRRAGEAPQEIFGPEEFHSPEEYAAHLGDLGSRLAKAGWYQDATMCQQSARLIREMDEKLYDEAMQELRQAEDALEAWRES